MNQNSASLKVDNVRRDTDVTLFEVQRCRLVYANFMGGLRIGLIIMFYRGEVEQET